MMKFAEVHCLVTGNANKWYWQLLQDHEGGATFDYFSLKKKLLGQLKAAESEYELIGEIMERKQQPMEWVEDYYGEILYLTSRMRRKMPEQELIKIINSKVKPSLETLIFIVKVENIADLKAECKRAEKLPRELIVARSVYITRNEAVEAKPRNIQ
uniref:Retrotrans_gag domain-containing protein n=1 Tax=Glossina pallidipes TaxID=7398 RepID=A0A1A9Z0R5_GLOPL